MKKTKILSLILAAVMLLSLIPAVGLTASAASTSTKPTTLPDLNGAGVPLVGFHYAYDSEKPDTAVFQYYPEVASSCNTGNDVHGWNKGNPGLGNLTNANASAGSYLLPEATQGQTFETINLFTGSMAVTSTSGTVSSAQKLTDDLNTVIPWNAVGFLFAIERTDDINTGVRINPVFTELKNESTSKNLRTVRGNGSYVYFYDEAQDKWGASPTEHGYRIPGGDIQYLYIPFETWQITTKTEQYSAYYDSHLTTSKAVGMTLENIEFSQYGSCAFSVKSVDLVTVGDRTLPDLNGAGVPLVGYHYDINASQNPDPAVFEYYSELDSSCNTTHDVHGWNEGNPGLGNLTNENASAGSYLLPEATQGQTFGTTNLFTGSMTVTNSSGAPGQELTTALNTVIPANAVGFLFAIDRTNQIHHGIRINPVFEELQAKGIHLRTVVGNGSYVYFYDEVLGKWGATPTEHASRVPGGDNIQYFYIPFETWQKSSVEASKNYSAAYDPHLTTDEVIGMTLQNIEFSIWGNDTPMTIKSVDIVTVGDEIHSASMTISDSLTLNVFGYYESKPANPILKVTPVDTNALPKYTQELKGDLQKDGGYKFSYGDILPQFMCDEYTLTLMDGTEELATETFTVKKYCKTIAEETNGTYSPQEQALASDLLRYGAAAQEYAGYKTEALATAGVTLTQGSSTDVTAITDGFSTQTGSGTENTLNTVCFALKDRPEMWLTFNTTECASVKAGDRDLTLVWNGNTAMIDGILPNEYGTTITVTVESGMTYTFTVNAYLKVAAADNSYFTELAGAIYALGTSAKGAVDSMGES